MRSFIIGALAAALLAPAAAQQSPARRAPLTRPSPPQTVEAAPPLAAPASAPAPVTQPAPVPFAPLQFDPIRPGPVGRYFKQEPRQVYEWLASELSTVPGKPDAYSTTEERAAYQRAMREKLNTIGPIALPGRCGKKYNADQQHMSVSLYGDPIDDYKVREIAELRFLRAVTLQTTDIKDDSYTAQNAYGATSEIQRRVATVYALAVPRGEENEPVASWVSISPSVRQAYTSSMGSYQTGFPMPSAEARKNDPKMACLLIVRPVEPFVLEYKERKTPTRDMPFDHTFNTRAIVAKLDSIIVANTETDEVYIRVDRIAARR